MSERTFTLRRQRYFCALIYTFICLMASLFAITYPLWAVIAIINFALACMYFYLAVNTPK